MEIVVIIGVLFLNQQTSAQYEYGEIFANYRDCAIDSLPFYYPFCAVETFESPINIETSDTSDGSDAFECDGELEWKLFKNTGYKIVKKEHTIEVVMS